MADELFPVLEMPVFRARYPAEILKPRAMHTANVARALRQRLGERSVLGVSFYPWHDQTTLWWFEQGLLSLLAATKWNTTWVTDARYTFDDERLAELNGRLTIVRHRRGEPWHPPEGGFDTVIALFPCDEATRAARQLGARLITFAIKNLHQDEQPLTEAPPDGTPLWHAFAGSTNFLGAARGLVDDYPMGLLRTTAQHWRLVGAPFPTNRYYFPLRPGPPPIFDALLFGSKGRDYPTAFAALARAGAGWVAALANPDDADAVRQSAEAHGVDVEMKPPMSHVNLLQLLEQTRVVLNPIVPPDESHYSLSTPLTLGRPIVVTALPSTQPFAGPGVQLAPRGDVAAWAAAIRRFLDETAAGMPHEPALKQGLERHDMDRFFASAIVSTVNDGAAGAAPPARD